MKLTTKQKREILPLLQDAVQTLIDKWDYEGQIEAILGVQLDHMATGITGLAVSYDKGSDVQLKDVQRYIDGCEVIG